ncbi:Unknown protein, partial [Striga hermonthica]
GTQISGLIRYKQLGLFRDVFKEGDVYCIGNYGLKPNNRRQRVNISHTLNLTHYYTILNLTKDWTGCIPPHRLRSPPPLPVQHPRPRTVVWLKPKAPWVKLNTDGTFDRHTGAAGGGGLIRDHGGASSLPSMGHSRPPRVMMQRFRRSRLYPDSGASAHVTNELGNLNIASEYDGQNQLQVGNGSGVSISHIGNTFLKCPDASKAFILKELLHVPCITKNLISVSKFAHDNDVYFEFYHTFCLVKDQTTQATLLRGKVKNGLYQFNFQPVKKSQA